MPHRPPRGQWARTPSRPPPLAGHLNGCLGVVSQCCCCCVWDSDGTKDVSTFLLGLSHHLVLLLVGCGGGRDVEFPAAAAEEGGESVEAGADICPQGGFFRRELSDPVARCQGLKVVAGRELAASLV